MNKHTPGPWMYGRTPGTEKLPEWYVTGKVCDVASVSIVMDTSKPMAEHEANARLIASAPELLEALENALNVLAGIATGDLETVKRDSPAIAQARAAIRKARGA